jgi:hypothetical protein
MGESVMTWNTPFDEFPFEDKFKWTQRASGWYAKHRLHVETLMDDEHTSYQPSGSDCGKPELWKPGHWRWYFKLGKK